MSFCTSFSSKRRPIRRLTANTVFFALVTAWRLAGAPTRISPSSAYATTEGVVRAPSEFSITFGCPPSMTATQLFVVPRSMPMIFAMGCSVVPYVFVACSPIGVFHPANQHARGRIAALSRLLARRPLRHGHHGRTQDAVVQHITLLVDRHDRIGGRVARHHLDRLVAVRVEFLAGGVDLLHVRARERRLEVLQRDLGAGLERLG